MSIPIFYSLHKQCSFCLAMAEYTVLDDVNVCAYHCRLIKEGMIK